MTEFTVRRLAEDETGQHRRLCDANPDTFIACMTRRIPAYCDIAAFFDPDDTYAARQRLLLGAFTNGRLIGTVGVERTERPREVEPDEDRWKACVKTYSERDSVAFATWTRSLQRTLIGAPHGSLTLHSLVVAPEYRRMDVASRLVRAATGALSGEERSQLYTEITRTSWGIRWFESLSFTVVRKTWSLSEWLEFGCWGTALMQFRDASRDQSPGSHAPHRDGPGTPG